MLKISLDCNQLITVKVSIMECKTALMYCDEYNRYHFGKSHPFQPIRLKLTINLMKEMNLLNSNRVSSYAPKMASEEALLTVHSEEYIDMIKRMSKVGKGLVDTGDTPIVKGVYEATRFIVGGSILGADLIMTDEVNHAFNPGGGLHHASKEEGKGFCIFNDIAIATRHLQKNHGVKKVAIIDIDGHHGDGTQEIFYEDPLLTISFHRIDIYPLSGYISEIGRGEGKGYKVNVPLSQGTDHNSFLYAFEEVVPPLIRKYQPEILLCQFGVDSHFQDPLVGLSLTTRSYVEISRILHDLAHEVCDGRMLLFGGGGYNPNNVARCWTLMFAVISGSLTDNNFRKFERIQDKANPQGSSNSVQRLKNAVMRIKQNIFPLHGL